MSSPRLRAAFSQGPGSSPGYSTSCGKRVVAVSKIKCTEEAREKRQEGQTRTKKFILFASS